MNCEKYGHRQFENGHISVLEEMYVCIYRVRQNDLIAFFWGGREKINHKVIIRNFYHVKLNNKNESTMFA